MLRNKEMSEIFAEYDRKDPARNSALREKTRVAVHKSASFIDEKFPFISPHLVTTISGAGQIATVKMAESVNNSERKGWERGKVVIVLAFAHAVFAALDGIDGELARIKNDKNPGSHNENNGQLFDYATDRFTEDVAAKIRQRTAGKLGKRFAEKASLLTRATNCAPGIARAATEAKGNSVPEHGENLFELVGTRPGRVAIVELGMIAPQFQLPLDCIQSSANVYSTCKRFQVREGSVTVPEDKRAQAKDRIKLLSAMTIYSIGSAVRAYRRSHQR